MYILRNLCCRRSTALLKQCSFFRVLCFFCSSSSRFGVAGSRDVCAMQRCELFFADFIVDVKMVIAVSISSIDLMVGFPGTPFYNKCLL